MVWTICFFLGTDLFKCVELCSSILTVQLKSYFCIQMHNLCKYKSNYRDVSEWWQYTCFLKSLLLCRQSWEFELSLTVPSYKCRKTFPKIMACFKSKRNRLYIEERCRWKSQKHFRSQIWREQVTGEKGWKDSISAFR